MSKIPKELLREYFNEQNSKTPAEQVKNLYDVDISAEMVSNITNRILLEVS